MTAALLNLDDPTERRVADRLRSERILWLTTISGRGRPHAVPVWFAWDDPTIIVFSRPDTAKVGHLRAGSDVGVHLDSAGSGTDVVLGEGSARLADLDEVPDHLDGFARKYDGMFGGQSFDDWLATFSRPIVVTVDKLVAWVLTADGLDYRSLPAR